jgi:hypothetical protein
MELDGFIWSYETYVVGQNAEFRNVLYGGKCSYHWALKSTLMEEKYRNSYTFSMLLLA